MAKMTIKLAGVAALACAVGSAILPVTTLAESVVRVAMTAGDIPDWTGQPDLGGTVHHRRVGLGQVGDDACADAAVAQATAVLSGSMRVGDFDIRALSERQLTEVRGSTVSMIFQEPMTALDPVYTIGDQIAETVVRHEGCSHKAAMGRALELLKVVKVPSPERRLKAYPHELSGGLRQRAMIALALSCRPNLLLADEPTTALDATVQIQVLILLRKLQRELGMGVIFVTHDLGVAAQIADNVAVMYAGRIVEYGSVRDVLMRPSHPYTIGMLASTIHGGQARDKEIEAIPGSPPDMRRLPPGCSFGPRCRSADHECSAAVPPPTLVASGHLACCFKTGRLDQIA